MSVYTSKSPHPYGVLPTGSKSLTRFRVATSILCTKTSCILSSGNALLLKDPYSVRRCGFGIIRVLSDEAILEMLSFLDGRELTRVLIVSRALYVYGNYSDLWRDLTLRNSHDCVDFVGTWKDTFTKLMIGKTSKVFQPHRPIKVSKIFCNVLHRSWMCHTCDLEFACPGFFNKCDIVRRNCTEMTTENFVEEFESKNRPVIITNATAKWSAMKNWNPEYLSDKCGGSVFRATSATASHAASFTMKEYFRYSAQAKEEAALYLFDRDFTTRGGLGDDYDVPDYFNSKIAPHGTDLFHVFGESQRPDYRWLIAGESTVCNCR